MQTNNRKSLIHGLVAGAVLTAVAGVLMGQATAQTSSPYPEYFVTASGVKATLWLREGTTLRAVGHGQDVEEKDIPKEAPKGK